LATALYKSADAAEALNAMILAAFGMNELFQTKPNQVQAFPARHFIHPNL
jgi:hypothetical protein